MTSPTNYEDVSSPSVSVWVRLWGERLDPAMVTAVLGVPGTKMAKKGSVSVTSEGKQVVAKTGRWILHSGVESEVLLDHIVWLRNALRHATEPPFRIDGVDMVEVDVFVALGSDGERVRDYQSKLSKDELAWITGLGATLHLTVIYTRN